MRHPATALTLAPLVLCAFTSCATSYKQTLPELAETINATYAGAISVARPGDTLRVSFPEQADWTHDVLVRPDGAATFLGVDDLSVAGRTLEQIDSLLTEAYADLMTQTPTLTVSVHEPGPGLVSVMGEVGKPGAFEIGPSGRMSFLEALAQAGGPTTNTSHLGKTLMVRWVPAEQRHHVWKFDARRRHWDSEEAVLMAPGDVVFVPNTPIDRAGIWLDMWIRRMIPFPRIFVSGGV